MYLPIVGIEIHPGILIGVGFVAGVLGGFFGIGGAFMVTPTLNILGFPMTYAIGTDLAHVFGKSIIATRRHRKLGHVDLRLGLLMLLGTVPGVKLGLVGILYLERLGVVEEVVRGVYIVLLLAIGGYMVFDYFRFTRDPSGILVESMGERIGTRFSRRLQRMEIPPFVSLPESNIRRISIWPVLLVGCATGFLAGFLGVGGGFVRMPALVYAIGVPTTVAVGTDLFEIVFSAGVGTFLYALEGKVDLVAALVMLLGAAVGAQIGTLATRYIKGMRIRLYFGYTILAAALSVVLKSLAGVFHLRILGTGAVVLILTVAALLTLVVLAGLIRGILEERLWWG